MNSIEWIKIAPYFSIVFLFLIIAEYFRKVGFSKVFTRKFVHFGVGITTMFTPYFFKNVESLIFAAISFIVINLISTRLKLFTATEAKQKTFGTVYFPLSFLILLYLFWDTEKWLIVYGISLLTFADSFASIAGEKIKKNYFYFPLTDKKSVAGTITLFLIGILISILFLIYIQNNGVAKYDISFLNSISIMLLMGFLMIFLENFSIYGTDNLSLTILAPIFFKYLLQNTGISLLNVWSGFLILVVVFFIAIQKKWLSIGGAMLMVFMGLLILIFGNWQLLIPLFLFFTSSSNLSKLKDKLKGNNGIDKKNSTRDFYQVLVNGIIPTIIIVFSKYFFIANAKVYYFAAIAAVNADTWSTEIGGLSKRVPISIVSFKKVPAGTSGGITLLGLIAALGGALFIAMSGYFIMPNSIGLFIVAIITISGFLASIIDSLLGALLQVKYKCVKCKLVTEKKIHCKMQTAYFSGLKYFNNDFVNLMCALSSALFVYMFI